MILIITNNVDVYSNDNIPQIDDVVMVSDPFRETGNLIFFIFRILIINE